MDARDFKRFPWYLSGKYRDSIVRLCELDENIKNALESKSSYVFTIHIDDLHQIHKLDAARITRYEAFINYMKSFDIEMRVISKRRNRNIEVINLIKLNKEENNE